MTEYFFFQVKKLEKLINIAKPTEMPKLSNQKSSSSLLKGNVLIGKRWGLGGAKSIPKTISAKPKEPVFENSTKENTTPKDFNPPKCDSDDESTADKKEKEVVSTNLIQKSVTADKKDEKIVDKKPFEKDHGSESFRIKGPTLPQTPASDQTEEREIKISKGCVVGSFTDQTIEENPVEDTDEPLPKKPKKRRPKKYTKYENDKDDKNKDSDDDNKVEGDYDISDPKVATWLPPTNQTGDGRTSLNDKYGY